MPDGGVLFELGEGRFEGGEGGGVLAGDEGLGRGVGEKGEKGEEGGKLGSAASYIPLRMAEVPSLGLTRGVARGWRSAAALPAARAKARRREARMSGRRSIV